jgi:hypothetical protein
MLPDIFTPRPLKHKKNRSLYIISYRKQFSVIFYGSGNRQRPLNPFNSKAEAKPLFMIQTRSTNLPYSALHRIFANPFA